MVDIATLGLAVDSRQVKTATSDLDKLTQAGAASEKSAESAKKTIDRLISSLERESRTLGMTSQQIKLYDLRSAGATQQDLARAKAAANVIDAYEKQQGELKKIGAAAGNTNALIGRLAGPIAAALSVRQIVAYADEWTNLNNRLKLVTDSTAELAIAQGDVFRIAQDTRQSLTATAELYQRIASNTDQLGLSLSDVSGVVETISQTLVISGASATSAQAALIQLGQAFASGVLRGEEFNSVMEQAPALAQALADGLGVSRGELRALANDGELTADKVIGALQRMSSSVEEDFGKTTGTVSQSFTALGNSITKLIGYFNDASGAGNAFARAIKNSADAIDSISDEPLKKLERQRQQLRDTLDAGLLTGGLGKGVAIDLQKQIAAITAEIDKLTASKNILANEKPLQFSKDVIDIAGAEAAFSSAGKGLSAFSNEAIRARESVERAIKAQRDSINGVIADLERESAMLGKTSSEIAIYDLYSQGATKTDLDRARAAIALVDAYEQQQDMIRSINDEIQKSIDEDIAVEEKRLEGLVIGTENATGEMSVFAKRAAENMQDAFADFLFDPFADGLDGMAENFGRILQRMVAEAAAAEIFDAVLGKQGAGGQRSGGVDWGSLAASFVGLFDSGGDIPSGGWGIAGEKGPEIIRGPATVISRENTSKMMQGGSSNVFNFNLPGITNAQEAKQAKGMLQRTVARAVAQSQRYS